MKHWLNNSIYIAILSALLSAIFYAFCIPFAKLLSNYVPSVMLGGFLYLGAGIGLGVIQLFIKKQKNHLTKAEIPFIAAIVLLDISAISFLMLGLAKTTGSNASLLCNFELAATSLFAYYIFREIVTKRMLVSIILIIIACIILTVDGFDCLVFNIGSVFVLLSALCWGLENNCTRKISSKSTKQITVIKGIFSGIGSLILALVMHNNFPALKYIIYALSLGFLSYGLSVSLYIYAQRTLGAIKTGIYYSFAPFLGVMFSLIFLGEIPQTKFYFAFIFMIIGTYLVFTDTKDS